MFYSLDFALRNCSAQYQGIGIRADNHSRHGG